MDQTPLMLLDFSLEMVWAPMVRILADLLEVELDEISTHVERRAARAHHRGRRAWARSRRARRARSASRCRASSTAVRCSSIEHVTRIDDDCAPDWPTSTQPGGEHRVRITGHPNLDVTVHGTEPGEPGAAGGGNATAANRIVNAIPAVCAAPGRPGEPARPPADHRRAAAHADASRPDLRTRRLRRAARPRPATRGGPSAAHRA